MTTKKISKKPQRAQAQESTPCRNTAGTLFDPRRDVRTQDLHLIGRSVYWTDCLLRGDVVLEDA